MSSGYLVYLNLLLLPRLLKLFRKTTSWREISLIAGNQLVFLSLTFNINPAVTIACLLILMEALCLYCCSQHMLSDRGYQTLMLLILLLLPGFISTAFPFQFRPAALALAGFVINYQPFLLDTDPEILHTLLLYLVGFLLLANETNLAIRAVFSTWSWCPMRKAMIHEWMKRNTMPAV